MLRVVEVTERGAVPVARVEVSTPLIPRVVTPEMAPAVEISQAEELIPTVFEPPPMETAPVEVPVPIFVAKLEEAFMLIAAPEIVAPAVPVRRPSIVIAPIPVIAPVVDISQSEVFIDPVSPLSPRVKVLLAVNAPLAVSPLVAVINPEMVGVAVQAVPVTVRLPPKLVRLLPDTVRVPATSSLEPGLVVPTPTLPAIKATSVPSRLICRRFDHAPPGATLLAIPI